MKPDFSTNLVLVGEYQSYERRRWSAILGVGSGFLTPDVIEAGGGFIRDAYARMEPISAESLRTMDVNREIATRAARAASSISAAAEREIRVCEHHLRRILSELVALNRGLVKNMAARYARSVPIDVSELEQEGFFGIKKSAECFDISRGNEFSTYAVWWIRAVMKRYACNHSADVRMPIHRHDRDRAIRKKAEAILSRKDQRVSLHDLANMLREHPEDVFLAMVGQSSRFLSLDAPSRAWSGDERGRSMGDGFQLPSNADQIDDDEASEELRETVRDLLAYAELSPRSENLLRLRYGIGSEHGEPKTLEEIGGIMNLTKERIRQIERDALTELREAAAEIGVPRAATGSTHVHPNRKFGSPDVLAYIQGRPGLWLSVDDIHSGLRWMTKGSIAACLRWIQSQEPDVHRDGKQWCYKPSQIPEQDPPKTKQKRTRALARRTRSHSGSRASVR